MNNHWLNEARKRLQEESAKASDVSLDRLREQGIIDDRGEVTGHLRRWNAFLAITEINRNTGAPQITAFRCLKPVFGMPGGATVDVSRDSIVRYLREGKKIITASWDGRLGMWKQGSDVRLSPNDSVRSDAADSTEDDVGALPEFSQSTSQL